MAKSAGSGTNPARNRECNCQSSTPPHPAGARTTTFVRTVPYLQLRYFSVGFFMPVQVGLSLYLLFKFAETLFVPLVLGFASAVRLVSCVMLLSHASQRSLLYRHSTCSSDLPLQGVDSSSASRSLFLFVPFSLLHFYSFRSRYLSP